METTWSKDLRNAITEIRLDVQKDAKSIQGFNVDQVLHTAPEKILSAEME